jgi:trk system potassium uptake protein
MNYRLVLRNLSYLSMVTSLLLLPSALWAVYFKEWGSLMALLQSSGVALAVGGVLYGSSVQASPKMFQREALLLVAVGWLLVTALGALPFYLGGVLGPIDAFFESMSGFTTTGATVVSDIEAVPKSILFWRSVTHWLGGIGIVLIFLAVLPYLGAGGRQLFRSESSRPDPSGHTPRIGETVAILYRVYLGLTVLLTVLLMLGGMDLYEAMCHTFSTLASGGFSTRQASIGAFDSLLIEVILIMFMVLAGTNFGLLFALYKGNWKALYEDTEWRVYVLILAGAALLIAINLSGFQASVQFDAAQEAEAAPRGFFQSLRVSAFTVCSIMTTTGFVTEDYDAWPHFSKMLLVLIMFVGGSAGSTAGGMKVLRVVLLLKMIYWRVEKTFRPRTKRAIRISGGVVNEEIQTNIYAFFTLHLFAFGIATMLLSLLGLPFESAVSGVAATLNCVGPAMQHLGATEDYALLPGAAKLLLSGLMLLGRLELFTISALFLPGFWRRS